MFDTVLRALAEPTRRRLLFDLMEANPRPDIPLSSGDRQFTPEEKKRQQIALNHKHLPMLESNGFINWDTEAGEVTKGRNFEDLEPVLSLLQENRDRFPGEWQVAPTAGEASR